MVLLNAQARGGCWPTCACGQRLRRGRPSSVSRGKPIQSKTVQRAVARFARAAGLKGVMPHRLRHTFAKGLIDSGVGLEKVAALLGHASLTTTRIYISPELHDLEELAEEES